MNLRKLSLVAALALGVCGHLNATDTLEDAFKNGKVSGELKAWYWDKTTEQNGVSQNYNITNFALELSYVTAELNGFKGGVTLQSNATPFAEPDAKVGYVDEEYASGSVLSEAYLEYLIGKTDIKLGRQYVKSPLIGGNYMRLFKESFQGITAINKDIPNTSIYAYYFNQFQGRTSNISGDGVGNAPVFSKTFIILAPATTEGVYSTGIQNKSIENLTLTAQYVLVNDMVMTGLTNPENADNVNIYFAEASYMIPLRDFKLKFDAAYLGSRTGDKLDQYNMNGDLVEFQASMLNYNGFSAALAYSTVSENDDVLLGVGNGIEALYTGILMRGPFHAFEAGTDTYVAKASYDFSKVGISGLGAELQYLNSKEKAPTVKTISTPKGLHIDYEGYVYILNYIVPKVKGLTLQVDYSTYDKDTTTALGVFKPTHIDELWFKAGYKF